MINISSVFSHHWFTLHSGVPLAAVILLVIINPELTTVVAPTDQIAHTALVAVVTAAVPGSVTVTLPLLTGLLWSATSLTVIVTTTTPLASWRLQGQSWV